LFLARALVALGIDVVLIGDRYVMPLIECGTALWGMERPQCELVEMPLGERSRRNAVENWVDRFIDGQIARGLSHLIAIERAGPSHTVRSVAEREGDEVAARFASETPPEHRDAHHNMRGKVIDDYTARAHFLFERVAERGLKVSTIGIGDGGNEIGMGRFRWSVLCEAIGIGPAAHTACRIATDHTIVAGVSNWGGYALALGVAMLRGRGDLAEHWNVESERTLIEKMVAAGAVDGVLKQRIASVDGLSLEEYLAVLEALRESAVRDSAGA
jgi:D-glutamate cyclase